MENSIKTCEVSLTQEEADALAQEFDDILQEFSATGYNGYKFTNPIMAKAFNKIYHALMGRNHYCVEKNLEAFYQSYASLNDMASLINQIEIDKENVPTLSIQMDVEGKKKHILLNEKEQLYLIKEIESLRNYCLERRPFMPRYKKYIENPITKSSIAKMYIALHSSADNYDFETGEVDVERRHK